MEFQGILLLVEKSLSEADVQAFGFLCVDLLGRDLSFISSKQLFGLLKDSDLLSSENTSLLSELLLTCKRHDLIRRLGLQEVQPGQSRLGAYRKLLFDLSENITDRDLKDIMFLLRETLPRKKLHDKMTTLELLREMEKEDLLNSDNLDDLKNILAKVCPILTKKIDKYERETNRDLNQMSNQVNNIGPVCQETGGEKMSVSEQVAGSDEVTYSLHLSNITSEESIPPSYVYEGFYPSTEESESAGHSALAESLDPPASELRNLSLLSNIDDNEVQSHHLSFTSDPGDVNLKHGNSPSNTSAAAMDLPEYGMNGDKRGVCLIINNHDFSKSIPELKNRVGTDIDEVRLKDVFEWLGFEVEVRQDLPREAVLSLLMELSQRDHSQADCLVCCVLSHGLEGSIYGVDGQQVKLRELTEPFSGHSCPSLKEKPKLFFIQACQGKKEQPIVFIQSDGPQSRSLSTDAAVPRNSIPADADFLLGMATIPDHASFRDKREGTWFIQSLCGMLELLVPKGVDLLSILTEVNNDVSKKTAGIRKQIPQPAYTLRKRVVFPIPKQPLMP